MNRSWGPGSISNGSAMDGVINEVEREESVLFGRFEDSRISRLFERVRGKVVVIIGGAVAVGRGVGLTLQLEYCW